MYEICIYGNPILRKKAEPVTVFDKALEEFCEILIEKMYEYDGIGLAAPQIGISIRAIALDVSREGNSPVVFVNPEITWKSEELASESEGCLSVPQIRAHVERPVSITLQAQKVDGTMITLEKVDGLLARALQHEMDHLEGIMFVDRVTPGNKLLLASKLKKLARSHNEK